MSSSIMPSADVVDKSFEYPLPRYNQEDGSPNGTIVSGSSLARRALIWVVSLCLMMIAISSFRSVDTQEQIMSAPVADSEPFPTRHNQHIRAASPAAVANSSLLHVFQVYQPIFDYSGATRVNSEDNLPMTANSTTVAPLSDTGGCEVVLMEHVFAYSYGMPYVGNYTPPSCDFNRIIINFTATSKGRQFDRLAIMYLGDSEIWRTSTAEPTATGIEWHYTKDVSEYIYFWKQPQKLIFDLGNLIDSTYTGTYNTTLTATFLNSADVPKPADLILPISARQSALNGPSLFTVPEQNATNIISLPRNANRAVVTLSACGQATEEFWYTNVFSSAVNTFTSTVGTLYGFSPWREIQLYIDGNLAGAHLPKHTIFTGGIVPGLWRPIVGLDAFDLREYEIDVTPWLPLLSNGKPHSFEIRVVGLDDNNGTSGTIGTIGSSWYVTGKVFLWLDDANSVTTGTLPTVLTPAPVITLSQRVSQSHGVNGTLSWNTTVSRTLSVSSMVKSQKTSGLSSWTQVLSYNNIGLYTDQGSIEINNIQATGEDQSTGTTYYKSTYSYPLFLNSSYFADAGGNFSLGATIVRGLHIEVDGNPVLPTGLQSFAGPSADASSATSGISGTYLSTTQNGSATYYSSPSAGASYTFGSTSQDFHFGGINIDANGGTTELYNRDVAAVNSSVIYDRENLFGSSTRDYALPLSAVGNGSDGVGKSPKEAIGRGLSYNKPLTIQVGN